MRTDTLLYNYFNTFPESLFRLIGESEEFVKDYKFASEEIKESSCRLDGILAPNDKSRKIYFLECQFQRKDLYQRLFSEIFIYFKKKKIENDWTAVVIYPERKIDKGVTTPYKIFSDSGKLIRIYLNELPEELAGSFPLNILNLIISDEQSFKNKITEIAKTIERGQITKEEFEELIMDIAAKKFSKMTIEEVRIMLRPMINDIRKSRMAQEFIKEGIEEGIKVGMEKGIEKGIEKGMEEAMSKVAKNLLKINTDPKKIAEITELSESKIRAITNKK